MARREADWQTARLQRLVSWDSRRLARGLRQRPRLRAPRRLTCGPMLVRNTPSTSPDRRSGQQRNCDDGDHVLAESGRRAGAARPDRSGRGEVTIEDADYKPTAK